MRQAAVTIQFIDPPDDPKKYPRSHLAHYIRRSFAALRQQNEQAHWSLVHATALVSRRGRKMKRGEVVAREGVERELFMAIATERVEIDRAEASVIAMLWGPLEEAAKAQAQARGGS